MRKLSVLIIVVLFVVGCSTQLGYRFADTYLEWELSEYVDLDGELERQVDISIDELHLWHAQTQLPVYRTKLARLQDQVKNDTLTEADIAKLFNDISDLWQVIRLEIAPYLHTYAPRLSVAQRKQVIAAMQAELTEREEELAEAMKEGRTDEERDEIFERVTDRATDWLGRLEPAQRRYLRRWFDARPDLRQQWLSYRQAWVAEFSETLLDPEAPDYHDRLEILVTDPEQLRSAELKAALTASREATVVMLHEIYNSMTPKQRLHLLGVMDDYLEDIDDLVEFFADQPTR